MLTIFLIMMAGVIIGYALRHVKFVRYIEKTITLTIFFMLFILGLTVGGNPVIVSGLGRFGWQAILLATAGSLGSVLASWIVYNLFFKKGGKL